MARLKSSLVMDVARSMGLTSAEEFVIVELTKEGPRPVYDQRGELMKFASGDDAAREARSMTVSGKKFQPRRVKDDQWKEREQERYTSKEYKELPWSNNVWWKNHAHIHGDHFPHVSVRNSVGLMAYTESDEKGSADVQTAIKPGKYLEKFFSKVLDPYIIRDLSTQFSNVFEDNCLIMATTEDEFEELYTKGPSSCMSHPIEKYLSPVHPVRMYVAGDLQLAYMKRDGRVVARSLVWPERKLYSRIYGDGGRIEPLLQKEGYKKGPPVGARLQRVIAWQNKKAKTGNQAFIVPHIDDASYVVDQGDFLVVGNINEPMPKKGGVKLVGQSGLSDWVFLRCGCGCNKESDGSLVDVYVDNASTTQRWCQQCVDEKALRCDYNGVYFAKAAGVEMHDGTIWWGRRFKEGGFTCAKSNLRYDNKHRMTFRDSDKSPAVYVSKQWFKDNGIKCKTCGVNTNKAGCSDACKERHVSTKKAREKMEQDVYGAASQTYNWTTASNAMGGTVYTGAGGGGNGGAGGGTVDWGQATAPTIRRR